MSAKVLVFLSLVALASASPTFKGKLPSPTIQLGGPLKVGSCDLGVGLGSLLKTIIGSKHTGRKSVTTILGMNIENFNDVCDLSTKIVVSLCDTVEASYRGLGRLLSRIIICLLRIIICFIDNGGKNPVCNNNINALVGVSVTGSADIQALIKLYDLVECESKLNAIIKLYTKGHGISKCKGSIKIIFRLALDLVNILKIVISGSGKLTRDHLTICFRKITILIGVMGNSRKNGLGLSIVKNYVPICNKHLKIARYTEITVGSEDLDDIDQGNEDNGPWRVSDADADDTSVSVNVCGLIGNLFKGLRGVTRLAGNLIKEISGLVIRSVEDVFILIVKIILALGGILDATCAGLGSLFVRIVAGLLKINLCFLGKSKYGVCKSGWDKQFQVAEEATSIDLVINLYGLGNCRSKVDNYISTYIKTNGKPSGSLQLFFDACVTLSDICDSRKWGKTIVVTVFKTVTTCMGAIGNSNSKGVGTSVCKKFIPTCKKHLADEGYTDIDIDVKKIDDCNEDDNNWSSDIDTSDGKTGWIIGGGRDVTVGGGKGGILKLIFGKIKGVTKLVGGVLDALLSIKINALKDVFTLIVNLCLVLQVTLNNIAVGLGTFFVRIVACIIKIAVCVKGCPGDKGICTKDWNKNFGITGDASTASDLIVLFKLTKVQDEYNGHVNKCTKGKGIKSAKGSIRLVLEKIRILIEFILNSDKISKTSVTDTLVHITTICGSIGNSQKKDSGKDITKEIVPKCGPVLKDAGYVDITIQITVIQTECEKSNDDNCDWNGGDNNSTTPSPGGDTTPTPGGDTTPTPGGDTTPAPGGYTTTPKGDITTPGGDTTPTPGGDTTPAPGGYTTTTKGDITTPGGDTTPTPGGYTTTPKGYITTPGGDTTPTPGGDTTPSPGGYTTTPKGYITTPGGDTRPTPGGDTTPAPGGYTTTPKGYITTPGGDTTPTPGGDTTPAPGGYTTTPKGDITTPGGDTTTPRGDNTTPSGGDTTTPTPSDTTTKGDIRTTPGGTITGTTPQDTKGITPTPAGDTTTPSSGTTTTPSPGGETTTLSPGDTTTPGTDTTTPGGDTTTPGGGKTTPSGGDTTTSSPGGDTTPTPGDEDDCGPSIGEVIKVIPGCTKLSTTVLIKQFYEFKIRIFIDVVNLVCKLTLSLGGIIDLIVTGLGSILTRIVAVIYKIGCCVHGYGDKTICTKEWNAQFGVNGDASTAKDLIALYRLQDCKSEVTTIITKYSGGKDISKKTDVISIILQRIIALVEIITSETITKKHFSSCFVHVISIFGCITNSYSKGSGTKIIKKVIPICGPYFVKQGCPDIRDENTKIITTATVGDSAQIDWKRIETKYKSGDLTTDVKDAFKEVKGSKDKASYNAIFNLTLPQSFDDCLSFAVKVIQALGAILDLFISGFGTLLVRIVGCLFNYIVAILGKSRNSKSFVCQKAYYDSFGVSVSGSTWADLVTGFKIGKCQSDLDTIKSNYIKSKGELNIVEKLFFNCGYNLIVIVNKGSKIQEDDLIEVFRIVITLLGGFANSCSPNLGKKICDSFIPECSSYLEKNNYPALTTHAEIISKSIDQCNNVTVSWVATTTVTTN